MTNKQKDIFINIAQIGMACGLTHPYEWLENWDFHLSHIDLQWSADAVYKSFLAFFKGTASFPEDPVKTWKIIDMINAKNSWYDRNNRSSHQYSS
jgi:hypothetical protein